jgi:hypothetical protein
MIDGVNKPVAARFPDSKVTSLFTSSPWILEPDYEEITIVYRFLDG